MSETQIRTAPVERVAREKQVEAADGGYFDHYWIGSPTAVRAWLASPEAKDVDILGPWVGALEDGAAQRAVLSVRAQRQMATPTNLRLADPDMVRGLLGVWAGR